MPSPEELAKLAQAQVENLATEAKAGASDAQIAEARRRAEQTYNFRESFYPTVRWTFIAALAASAVVMVLYVISQWGDLDPGVMVSFNAAVVVDTIGLAYIVAKHLFPDEER